MLSLSELNRVATSSRNVGQRRYVCTAELEGPPYPKKSLKKLCQFIELFVGDNKINNVTFDLYPLTGYQAGCNPNL